MAVSITISIDVNSQDIVKNTSNVTCTVRASWTYGSYNQLQKSGYLIIDGTKYTFTSYFNYNATTSGTQVLFTKTVDVPHEDDGTKTLECSASYTSGVSSGTVKASASKTLTTIARKSTMSVSNGTLGIKQTLTVTRKSTSLTHSIKAVCGSSTIYLKADGSSSIPEVKHSDCSIPFTPPLGWASYNTTGTSVTVTYTIKTYSGSESIGENSYKVTYVIPVDGTRPTVTNISIADISGAYETFGKYIQGQSKLAIKASLAGSYGSTIKSCRIIVNGKSYPSASITTDVLSVTGSMTIEVWPTDSRGRTNVGRTSITVTPYTVPKITSFTASRYTNPDNAAEKYIKVQFSADVTNLNVATESYVSQMVTYDLLYKKKNESTWHSVDGVADLDGVFSVSAATFDFLADTSISYDVVLRVQDDFTTISKSLSVGTDKKLWSIFKRNLGIAFGKIAELPGVMEIAYQTKLTGGLLYPALEPNTDLNDCKTPGFYIGKNVRTNNYINCPLTSGTFTLEVLSAGPDGQVWQRLTLCDKNIATTYERFYYGDSWPVDEYGQSEWVRTSDFGGVLLWQGVYYMSASQTATLAEPIHKQNNGIVLVFSRYSSDTAQNYHFNHAFVHKMFVKMHPGVGNTFLMTTDGSFSVMATKYLYIHDDRIVGNAINEATGTGTSGVKYENNGFVLRYVIGV